MAKKSHNRMFICYPQQTYILSILVRICYIWKLMAHSPCVDIRINQINFILYPTIWQVCLNNFIDTFEYVIFEVHRFG